MPINILMPALSPTMEKGNLAKWLKKEGDKVKSGDVIAEIETDKATMEVEAVDEGTIAKILVPEGTQDVAVNDVIAVLAGDGEDVKAAGAGAASAPPKAGAHSRCKADSCRHPSRHPLRAAPRMRPRQSPPVLREGAQARCLAGRGARRPMATPASFHRRWPVVLPRKPASRLRASTGPARTAGSSPAMSRKPNPARG